MRIHVGSGYRLKSAVSKCLGTSTPQTHLKSQNSHFSSSHFDSLSNSKNFSEIKTYPTQFVI